MNDPLSLDDFYGAYRRTSSRIYRILEDGYDFAVDTLIIDILARNALIIDAAFFLLVFGQIEVRLNAMAEAGQPQNQREALRGQAFHRRLTMALPGNANADLRRDIADWSRIRNDAARGRELTSGYDIEAVFTQARQLDALLASSLANQGKELT
ncbi:MAG TPA: hypothetical protein VGG99_03625 [Acetobacteraceae bacterium]|jgi:hypothetical protein